MTRRSSRQCPNPAQKPPLETKTVVTRSRGKPAGTQQTIDSVPVDLKPSIIANWNLPLKKITTCVRPELWPLNEPDPEKWPTDIVHLLHEASQSSRGDNKLFQLELSMEIQLRQSRTKSTKGKTEHMTAADLKKVCKRLESRPEGKEVKDKETEKAVESKPMRRTRASAKTDDDAHIGDPQKAGQARKPQDQKVAGPHGGGRAKRKEPEEQNKIKPGTKRQASDLPLRPARKLRNGKSPKPEPKPTAPPPITPANPPEESSGSEDQENAPQEPVSGRHIYGALIKPTTLTFNPDNEPAARALPRQTRKRGRADQDPAPTQVQIDSDPRDIDATGFLSELDPKEMRRRRKPRLSRLQQERVEEPPWSQEFPVALGTPMLTPAIDGPGDGIVVVSSPARPVGGENGRDEDAAIELLLLDLLPAIPDTSTPDERSMLENRISLIQRDIGAYRTAVSDIEARVHL
ncbi:uncharacterized protein EKO05_0010813 [Ascochyta rabiei]|uniref:Uncharacterized protein n=1 Tax=Didymella rabiei TaxID=5454 RepID=A0A163F5B2_DIDRA|nr:uncharacterized protein EKO05_0010813 [Ascochyta rabiei]KZM24155.1 hypothetical protein ST47_g4701 [Ascochyta rabiei]UPX20585.1 hypothetical protein EKO05_0010813 [Ascochyta rabiei]